MTNLISGEGTILKTDGRGRVQTPSARRESLLDEFERSGLSAVKFAALAGIKYQTFAAWSLRRRRQREGGQATAPPPDSVRWLEAVVAPPACAAGPTPTGVLVRLPGGLCVEVANLQQVALAAAVIKAVGPSC